MIVYGRNAVREALRGRRSVGRVWATAGTGGAEASWLKGRPVERVSDSELAELCGSDDHQGVCAEASPYPYARAEDLLAGEDALVLCLDQIQDPQNLGAVCRVAECAGTAGVVIPERRSAEVTPAVCKASAGAVEHLPIARVRNVSDYLDQAKRGSAWVYGATSQSTSRPALPYQSPGYGGRVVLVLGSEGRGLRPRVADTCDQLIALPMRGRVASLNVATAAAALVYGILHLRDGLDTNA